MQVERYSNKLDGRVFKGQDVVVFEPDENSNAFYTTAKVMTMTDNDKRRVNQLRKWMKESYRFRCAFQVKDSELCDIKGEKVFNLFCKLMNIKMFPDFEILVLTVVDATSCPELLYKVPDNWSGYELPKDFHRNMSEVDIIFYEGGDYYETIKIGDFCQLWNVKSVRCNLNTTNETIGYKLIMLNDESSIYTVPYGVGKTIVLKRTLERGPNEDFATDSEVELSLQNKIYSVSISSSEEPADEARQEDNLKNNIVTHQTNCNSKLLATDLKPIAAQTQTSKSEVKLPTKNHDISTSSITIKSGSTDSEQLFKYTSTSKQNDICEVQYQEGDLSGSDTDIEVLSIIPPSSNTNTVLHKEFSQCLPSDTEEYIQKGLNCPLNNCKVTDASSGSCIKYVGTKRKLAVEMNRTSYSDTSLSKRNNQTVFSKTEINNEGHESSQASSKSEFVINFKTLEMWRNTFPTLFNVEEVEQADNEKLKKDVDNNCKADIVQHINVFLVDVRPSLDDDSMDLVSGYCHSGCYEMFLHSTLIRDNRNKTHLCPACNKQGLKREVQLMLLVELVVMDTSGVYINVIACSKQAEKFFGCSVEQYMCDLELRTSIVKALLLHSVYKNIKMGCKKVPIINLHVSFQENKYFLINTKLKIK